MLKEDLQLSDIQYGYAVTAFKITYAFGFLAAGKFIDVLGTKLGYFFCILFWSIAATCTGISRSLASLSFWRGALGLTQSGNFPAAIKSVSEWFETKQRTFATSLFNSGPSIAGRVKAAMPLAPPWCSGRTAALGYPP